MNLGIENCVVKWGGNCDKRPQYDEKSKYNFNSTCNLESNLLIADNSIDNTNFYKILWKYIAILYPIYNK